MAEVTIADGPNFNVTGRKRVLNYKLTAPADTNTLTTGLYKIEGVVVTQLGDVAAGTDIITPASISGGTITWSVDGTAADCLVTVTGI